MYEDETVLKYVSPLTTLMQERVDRILLAVAGRLFEWNRDMTPAGARFSLEPWDVEAIRSSPLGRQLMLLARYVGRSAFRLTSAQVEQVMQRILRTVFGHPFDDGYSIPAKFHTTELGQLFHDAYAKMYDGEDLLTIQQAYQAVGVARQSVYDRIADGKLHPIYVYGDRRLLRSEIEAWKAERRLRKKTKE
jgi:predicted DNA-binding transcriptional regulator AlpA